VIGGALVELLLPGGGYALRNELRWAVGSIAAMVAMLLACALTPWAVWLLVLVRLAAVVDVGRRGRRGPPAGGSRWKPMLLVGAVGLGSAIGVRDLAIEMFQIPSVSMAPTLQLDDKIVVETASLRWRPPGRGEIVAFWNGPRTMVKRVIGVGGDVVAVRGGVLWVNGVAAPRRRLGPDVIRDRDERGRESRDPVVRYEERYAGRTYAIVLSSSADATADEPHWSDYPQPEGGCEGSFGVGAAGMLRLTTADGGCRVPPGTVFLMGDNRDNSNDSRAWGALPVERVFGRLVGVWLGGRGARLGRIGHVE